MSQAAQALQKNAIYGFEGRLEAWNFVNLLASEGVFTGYPRKVNDTWTVLVSATQQQIASEVFYEVNTKGYESARRILAAAQLSRRCAHNWLGALKGGDE